MKKIYVVVLMSLLWTSATMAQTSVPGSRKDTADSPHAARSKTKKMSHYLGIQVNQLISQIFNFNGSAPAVSNPFLITYAMNSIRTGWGLNAGLGYNVNTTTDDSNPSEPQKTTNNNFSLRLGIEKKSMLGKRWLVSYGLDALVGRLHNDVRVINSFFETSMTTKSTGVGPRLSLSYFISDRILVGTEATYYLKATKTTQNISDNLAVYPLDQANFVSTNTTTHSTDFTFSTPVAVFLIMKVR